MTGWRQGWPAWWRAWVLAVAGVLFGILCLAYLVLWLLTWVLMVFAPGRYVARAVLPLGRTMAAGSLAAAAWFRGDVAWADRLTSDGPGAAALRLPPYPRGAHLSQTLWLIVRSPVTWRAYGWLGLSILAVPVHLAAVALFMLAPLWARLWAVAAFRLVGGLGEPRPGVPGPHESAVRRREKGGTASSGRADQAPHNLGGRSQVPPTPSATQPARRGYGLLGMRERVAAAGGSLHAGPTPDGGFEVRAVLPVGLDASSHTALKDEPPPTQGADP
jgi:hypothetical protein